MSGKKLVFSISRCVGPRIEQDSWSDYNHIGRSLATEQNDIVPNMRGAWATSNLAESSSE